MSNIAHCKSVLMFIFLEIMAYYYQDCTSSDNKLNTIFKITVEGNFGIIFNSL